MRLTRRSIGHLADVDTNPATLRFTSQFERSTKCRPEASGTYNGNLPNALVYPFRTAVAPRLGLALRLPKQIVLRAGYGINYTVGQYATLATTMAHQPPFANEQNNEASACPSAPADCLTFQNGFPAPDTFGSYALDPHYHLPYVQMWNLDCAEDHALERGGEHRLQRIEGQSSGRHHRAATKRNQPRHRSH